MAGAPGPLVAGCRGEGKEGHKHHQLQLQQLIKDDAVGPPAPRRQPKGVHKKGKLLQWPQLQEQALAGAPGPLVAGCRGESKEGQSQHQLQLQQHSEDGAIGPPALRRQPKGVHKRASSCNGPSSRNKLWQAHQGP